MATITFLPGATDPNISLLSLADVYSTLTLPQNYADTIGADVYTEAGVTSYLNWYLGRTTVSYDGTTSYSYYYSVSAVQFGNQILVEQADDMPVATTYYWPMTSPTGYETFGTNVYTDTLPALTGATPGDLFVGNTHDNQIFVPQQYGTWRGFTYAQYEGASAHGDDTINAGNGSDTLNGGWGEDILDGEAGFDFYAAGVTKAGTPYASTTYLLETAYDAQANVLLSNGAGVLANLSGSTIDVQAVISQAMPAEDFNEALFAPILDYLPVLNPFRVIDSFQLDDEIGDRLFSIEGIFGSDYPDVIVTSGSTWEAAHGFGPGGLAYGNFGNDIILITPGTAFVSGGQDDDLIIGLDEGNDLVNGDEGDDTLLGQDGSDSLWGGPGNDLVDGGADFDWFNTVSEPGPVRVNLSAAPVVLPDIQSATGYGATSALGMIPTALAAMIDERSVYAANSFYEANGDIDTITRTEGVRGTPFGDLIIAHGVTPHEAEGFGPGGLAYGELGDDVIIATPGTVFISGGEGDDLLFATGAEGEGVTANGDQGNDIVLGGVSNDTLSGNDDNDTTHGGPGDDLIIDDHGDDSMFGGPGSDVFGMQAEFVGGNRIYGGNSEDDGTDFINGQTFDAVYYPVDKSTLLLIPKVSTTPGGYAVMEVTDPSTGKTDYIHHVNQIDFAGGGHWSQSDILEGGFLTFVFYSLADAFHQARDLMASIESVIELDKYLGKPDGTGGASGLTPSFKIFMQWLSMGAKVAESVAATLSSNNLEETIRTLVREGVRQSLFSYVEASKSVYQGQLDSLPLPPSVRNEIQADLDASEAFIKDIILSLADNMAVRFSQVTEDFGEALRSEIFDLWENLRPEIEGAWKDIYPHASQLIEGSILSFPEAEGFEPSPEDFKKPILILKPEGTPVQATEEQETITLLSRNNGVIDVIEGTPEQLDGDNIYNLWLGDKLLVKGFQFHEDAVTMTPGSLIVDIDTDGDGQPDTTIVLEGDYSGTTLDVQSEGGDTVLKLIADENGTAPPTAGADLLVRGPAGEAINGFGGNDTIIAGGGNDTIIGGLGDDVISPGTGLDSVDGSPGGSDTLDYAEALAAVQVRLWNNTVTGDPVAAGDTILNFENVQTGAGGDLISGNHLANVLSGGSGNDSVFGSGGADLLIGDSGLDYLDGGPGDDHIFGGPDADRLIGALGNDTLDGGSGNDSLTGGLGDDWLIGGIGVELLDGSPGDSDTLDYSAAINSLTVRIWNNTAFGDPVADGDTIRNFENVETGAGDDLVAGNHLANTLTGNIGNDSLYGYNGSDLLNGGAGIDVLRGGSGSDTLIGGPDTDFLTGGTDSDSFKFVTASNVGLGANRDQIMDFEKGVDVIDLSAISASVLSFVGTGPFTGADQVRVIETVLGSTIVQINLDADLGADAEIRLANVTGLESADFVL